MMKRKKLQNLIAKLLASVLVCTSIFSAPDISYAASNNVVAEKDIYHVHTAQTGSCYKGTPSYITYYWAYCDDCGGCIASTSTTGFSPNWWSVHSDGHSAGYHNVESSRSQNGTSYSLICTHSNEKIGTFEIIKGTTQLVPNANILGNSTYTYSWKINGKTASTIGNAICNITEVGTYTCTVTFKDPYSNLTRTESLSYVINRSIDIEESDSDTWTSSKFLTTITNFFDAVLYKINGITASKVTEVFENGTYEVEVKGNDGLTYKKSITVDHIDNERPHVFYDVHNMVCDLVSTDNVGLKDYKIYYNGSLVDRGELTGKTTQKSHELSLGTNTFEVQDIAGNISTVSADVYTLDEEVNLSHIHTHAGTIVTIDGKDYATVSGGCYTHAVSTPNIVYKDCVRGSMDWVSYGTTCPSCGDPTSYAIVNHEWTCSVCHNYFGRSTTQHCNSCGYKNDLNGGGAVNYRCYHNVQEGVNTKYELSCTHTDELIGTLSLKKNVVGEEYVLSVTSSLTNASIVSYSWYGSETSFSIRPNGNKATDVTGETTSSVVVPDFGTYTCNVVWKDKISGVQNTVTFTYTVNDFYHVSISADKNSWTASDIILTAEALGGTVSSYQWYKNGAKIDGATDKTYTATEYADYYCHVEYAVGAKRNSNVITPQLDKIAPTASISQKPVETTPSSYQKLIILSVTAEDTQSGVGSYQWFKNDAIITGATSKELTISKTSEGDTYKCEISDSVGNVASVQTLVYVDTDIPEIEIETEDLIQNTKVSITLKDVLLSSFEILKETTVIGSWFDINDKTFDMDYIIPEDGSYTLKATDSAGNVSTRIIPIAMSGIYGLNQTADLFHIHKGTAGSETPNGCYTVPYASTKSAYVSTGDTYQIPDGQWCDACGSNHCHGGHHVHEWRSVPCTRYKCPYDQEIVGTLTLAKSLDTGEYTLSIDDNLTHASIVSYKWTGAESPSTDAFPSVRPNGAKASDVNTLTTKSIAIPDFGTYRCDVTYKDGYSGATKTISFQYKVEDFDLEAPEVISVDEVSFDNSELTGITYNFDSTSNIYSDPDNTKYRQKKGVRISIEDNMALDYLEVNGIKTYLNSEKTAALDYWCTSNQSLVCKVVDKIGNTTEFSIRVNHVDTEAPIIQGVTYSTSDFTNKDVTVTIHATDNVNPCRYLILPKGNEHTSARAISLGYDKVDDYFSAAGFKNANIFDITDSHDYWAYVADEAGNVSVYEFNVDWIDKSAPDIDVNNVSINAECNNVTYNHNNTVFDFSSDKNARYITIHFKTKDKSSTLSTD